MDSQREKFCARLEELISLRKTTPAALSVAIGRDNCFIRDYMRMQKKGFAASELALVEQALECEPGELSWLLAGITPIHRGSAGSVEEINSSRGNLRMVIENEVANIRLEGEIPTDVALQIQALVRSARR